MPAPKEACLSGLIFAFIIGCLVVAIGAAEVLFGLPGKQAENDLMESYEKKDALSA
ncbi:hypothetical protein M2116_000819 [Aurantimicrobium minutum]|uniref:hypothetical protein n=1 Tax=Aurantimicrobium minutum TaxID=708131 RepID=UPI002405230F|nr:hypothetical protein [Aurantimicrobium minutum]MDF9809869.1 hypothetical protein [Aurantimicrobium minutum]